jgi:6-phosphogluconolactonase
VNGNGLLSLLGTASWEIGLGELTIDPTGDNLYVNTYKSQLFNYRIGTDGIARLDRKTGAQIQTTDILIVSGTSPVSYKAKNAFVSSIGDNSIASFAVNADGSFGSSTSVISQQAPFSLTMVPWGDQLLADSISPSKSLVPYTVMPNGALMSGLAFGASQTSAGVVIDPSGSWAFDIDEALSGVNTYAGSNGSWGIITYMPSGQPSYTLFPTGTTPRPIAADSAGRFVYVGNQGDNSITAFHHWGLSVQLLEVKGQWSSPHSDGSPFPLGAKPLALAVDESGSWLFATCDDQTLRVFSIDREANGYLQQITSKALPATPTGVAVDVNSRFVYVIDAAGLHAFSLNFATGSLTDIALGSEATIAKANGVYADPSGQFLYVTTSDVGTGAVLGFKIESDGTLTSVGSGPLATPNEPSSMTFTAEIK